MAAPSISIHITPAEGAALQQLDPAMSLPGIIRALVGEPEALPDGAVRPVCCRLSVRVSKATRARLDGEEAADLDFDLSDLVRVRYLGLEPWPVVEPVIRRPMKVVGRFSLVPRQVQALEALEHRVWVKVPASVRDPKRSLRRWLSAFDIEQRDDEPGVMVIRDHRGGRSASIWLTSSEMERLRDRADDGVAVAEMLHHVVFGVPIARGERCELGLAA